ncbi:ATP-binding cassette subfamily C protein [Rhodobacter sp. 140A]|nr:ATP-binding cassette subfamily C protein [Rhodobacter sp. 140A]
MPSPSARALSRRSPPPAARLGDFFQAGRGEMLFLAAISVLINLLMLTGPVFMMQVYDRVLSSRSLATLVVLLALVSLLYLVQAALDGVRTRAGGRIAARLDAEIAPKIFAVAGARARLGQGGADAQQPLRDLDTLRQFNSGGPLTLFDLPWTPVYLLVLTLFSPVLGLMSTIGAAMLFALTLLADRVSQGANARVSQQMAVRNALAENGLQDCEGAEALGIFERIGARWDAAHRALVQAQLTLAERAGDLRALAKGFRFLLQSLTLAAGAGLVIRGELSAGSMMATSVISSRALAPIEQAIAQWRGFRAARGARARLEKSFALLPAEPSGIDLAPPARDVVFDNFAVSAPGQTRPLLAGVNMRLEAGDGLGVIGPSGAGKTSLLRGVLGLWPGTAGGLRFDGAAPDQWRLGARGFAGYLPQDIRLMPGTVAENIASLEPDAPTDEIVRAAELAGAHEMILALPEGYNTRLGDDGAALSAGQRQRIALARAVYRRPFLVVMDEPNAHLDAEGDQALSEAIRRLRAAGSIVICVAHRPSALAALNKVAMIEAGRLRAYGPRDEILGQVVKHPRAVVQK